MIQIIWEFYVVAEHIAAFEEIYASHGAWALLFQQSKYYHGTLLLKDHTQLGRYLTLDRWDALSDFEVFKSQYLEAYSKLDSQSEKLTFAERKIGVFDVV